VLNKNKTYILDMRTAQDPPAGPPTESADADATRQAVLARMLERYVSQPPIDFYHRHAAAPLRALAESAETGPQIDIPIIF
jgi:benzoylformate decarboxylase